MMRTTMTVTALLAVLVLGLVTGLASMARAQDDDPTEDTSEPDDDPTEDSSEPDDDPTEDSSEPDDDPTEDASEPDDDPTEDGSDDDRIGGARVYGADRFSTSVAISQYEFAGGAEEAYLARADNFADAVAAGALSRGPVLLVPQCGELPAVVADEIARLDVERVVALGGPGAICDDMLDQAIAAGSRADDGSGDDGSDDDGSDDDADDGPRTESTTTFDMAVGEEATMRAFDAGSVTIRRTDAGVELVSATPAAGWSIRPGETSDPGEAEASFTDGVTRVDLEAEVEDGLVRVRVRSQAA